MTTDGNKKVTTSITLSKKVMNELNAINEFTGISKSQLVELAINCQPCYEGLKQGINQMKERKK